MGLKTMLSGRPEIYAKASLSYDQITVKEAIGCDGIEIQLLGELVRDRKNGIYNHFRDAFDIDNLPTQNVKVVHAPIIPKVGDVPIEVLVDLDDVALLFQVFEVANYIGRKNGHSVKIVLHSETYYDSLMDIGGAWYRLVRLIDCLLNMYEMTEVCIENVSPLRGIGKDAPLHLSNNTMFDNVEMVDKIRSALGTVRVGTVLDTCHAMLACKYINGLYQMVGDRPIPDLSMRKYFEMNAPYVKLIHLCDMTGSGYGKGRHGIPFTDSTRDKCYSILDLHREFCPACPITLEVEETDFAVSDGYRNTREIVLSYY